MNKLSTNLICPFGTRTRCCRSRRFELHCQLAKKSESWPCLGKNLPYSDRIVHLRRKCSSGFVRISKIDKFEFVCLRLLKVHLDVQFFNALRFQQKQFLYWYRYLISQTKWFPSIVCVFKTLNWFHHSVEIIQCH